MPLIIHGRPSFVAEEQHTSMARLGVWTLFCRKATVQRQKYASDLGLFSLYDAVEPVRHVGLVSQIREGDGTSSEGSRVCAAQPTSTGSYRVRLLVACEVGST